MGWTALLLSSVRRRPGRRMGHPPPLAKRPRRTPLAPHRMRPDSAAHRGVSRTLNRVARRAGTERRGHDRRVRGGSYPGKGGCGGHQAPGAVLAVLGGLLGGGLVRRPPIARGKSPTQSGRETPATGWLRPSCHGLRKLRPGSAGSRRRLPVRSMPAGAPWVGSRPRAAAAAPGTWAGSCAEGRCGG